MKTIVSVLFSLLSLPAMSQEASVPNVAKTSLKAFYLIRSGVPIEEKYAGEFARPLGHADTQVYVHASAATAKRPENTIISSPYGWYDASRLRADA